ncbi:MAG TPA: branched-chain amino acid ABC transporter substrate-binding protein [Methylomirabilota bacterium]|nr:branched-chain amino acid ABC transporter substrate-binding protein [Methylomirabilota bacterium]
MKRNGKLLVSTLAILTTLIGFSFGPYLIGAQPKGVIKIATQSPLSGDQAALGEGIKLGAQLAAEKLKGPVEKLGFKVEVAPFDDQAKPDVGVANAKSALADESILAVIGHFNSGVAIPSSEVYKEANLVMVSPSNTNPLITDRNLQNVNRVCGRDDVQGAVGAEFAKGLKVKNAYVIHDKTTYGQGVAEFFRDTAKKLGITILGFEGTEEKANFDSILTPIKARNPDLIYFGGIFNQAGTFFKQAREKGIRAKFLGPDGLDSPELAKIGGKAVVGMHYTTVAGPASVYPEAKKFIADFKERFKHDPTPFAAQAYDSTAIALLGIESAIKAAGGKKPTRLQVSQAVRKVKYKGITGVIEFDEKGDPKKAKYFVILISSENPEKWNDNKPVKTLEIAAPPLKKS